MAATNTPVPVDDLTSEFKNGGVSLLVGSGVSCACGLPSWDDLTGDMKKKLRKCCSRADQTQLTKFFKTATAPAIAGIFRKQFGDVAYYRFLRERFRSRSFFHAPLLQVISKLPTSIIFTTNYDKLLETQCRNGNGEDPVVITMPSQLTGLNGHEKRIVKIHGDIDYPHTIILTDDDYLGYDDKCEAIKTYLQGQIAFSTLVLIGFGLRDPNFDRIYAGARLLVPGTTPRVVALMAKQNPYDLTRWQDRGLLINHFAEYTDIHKYLKRVVRSCA